LVECGPQSLKSLGGVVCANVGDRLGHSEFMKLKAIRVFLNNSFIWYVFEEGSDSLFKLSGVIISARKTTLGTVKRVMLGHGE
jgi:hypothetical protein